MEITASIDNVLCNLKDGDIVKFHINGSKYNGLEPNVASTPTSYALRLGGAIRINMSANKMIELRKAIDIIMEKSLKTRGQDNDL